MKLLILIIIIISCSDSKPTVSQETFKPVDIKYDTIITTKKHYPTGEILIDTFIIECK